jgi:Flp pilus assembly pilin Flp
MIQVLNSVRAGLVLYVPEKVRTRLRTLHEERGQAFVEYALLLLFIAVAVAVTTAFTDLGTKIQDALVAVKNAINSALPSGGGGGGGS